MPVKIMIKIFVPCIIHGFCNDYIDTRLLQAETNEYIAGYTRV